MGRKIKSQRETTEPRCMEKNEGRSLKVSSFECLKKHQKCVENRWIKRLLTNPRGAQRVASLIFPPVARSLASLTLVCTHLHSTRAEYRARARSRLVIKRRITIRARYLSRYSSDASGTINRDRLAIARRHFRHCRHSFVAGSEGFDR